MAKIRPARIRCDVPIFFATTEGQTRRIAVRLSEMLHERGIDSFAIDIDSASADYVDWRHVRAVVVGASIHGQRHQRSAAKFVRTYWPQLNAHPSAFFSVSLSAASSNPREVEAARHIAEAFPGPLGWHPNRIASIAGALAYTKYGFLKRAVMKYIARKEGAPTDTSRDYELTNWNDVEQLAHSVMRLVQERAPLIAA
jgi:menaquinone-dependent protoporphyrinogen oxidase